MARRIYLLAPSAIAFAIFGCGGASDPGLFGASGVSGASTAGAPSGHGAGASSTPPASGGDTSDAGSVGLGGTDAGGKSAGGSGAGTSNAGGSGDGEAGHSGSGGSVDRGGTGGSAGHAEGGGAGHSEGGASTGGSAGAGTAGSAGSSAGAGGGSTEPTCSQLLAQAATELTAARACIYAGNAEQCTGVVETTCNCQVPVEKDDSVATKAYEATLKQLNAKHCSQVCPAIACLPVTRAECRANSGTTKGTCVSSFGVPTPVPAF